MPSQWPYCLESESPRWALANAAHPSHGFSPKHLVKDHQVLRRWWTQTLVPGKSTSEGGTVRNPNGLANGFWPFYWCLFSTAGMLRWCAQLNFSTIHHHIHVLLAGLSKMVQIHIMQNYPANFWQDAGSSKLIRHVGLLKLTRHWWHLPGITGWTKIMRGLASASN